MKLEQLYYNPKSPAAYAGEQALYKLAKQSSKKVKLQDVRDWLRRPWAIYVLRCRKLNSLGYYSK